MKKIKKILKIGLTNKFVINIMLIRERGKASFKNNVVIIKILIRHFLLDFVNNKMLIRKEDKNEKERRVRKITGSSRYG